MNRCLMLLGLYFLFLRGSLTKLMASFCNLDRKVIRGTSPAFHSVSWGASRRLAHQFGISCVSAFCHVMRHGSLMKPKVSCIVLVVLVLAVPALFGQLVNPNASLETRQLKTFLDSVYGKRIIAGQMDDGYLSYIRQHTGGKSPALMGYDLNGICPGQGGNHDAQKAINWVTYEDGIAQFQWPGSLPTAMVIFIPKISTSPR